MTVSNFWSNYEVKANNYEELHNHISSVSNMARKQSRIIVWRGQINADWPLTSKLYREFKKNNPRRITEKAFSKIEQEILVELRRWGLHSQKNGGRLSVLSQLAILQHFGTPTRLIDITFNALVGAFFATEYSENEEKNDGRLFAIDITDRLINENKSLRDWEDSLDTPWSDSFKKSQFQAVKRNRMIVNENEYMSNWDYEWTSHYYAWKPPALDARIAAQNGGFIFGGVVGSVMREGYIDYTKKQSQGSFQIANPNAKLDGKDWLSIDKVRDLTCLAIKPQSIPSSSMRKNTKNAVYSIKISSNAKKNIREHLNNIYGYTHANIYPDFPGFSSHGVTKILDK
ncbi:FRG domain-containing protein [Lonsdalea quercina]|uniref:FRG domain-containing protein n=1 Tax=Lonsdalea quercina TaxID=71657 RepID=UPI0039755685